MKSFESYINLVVNVRFTQTMSREDFEQQQAQVMHEVDEHMNNVHNDEENRENYFNDEIHIEDEQSMDLQDNLGQADEATNTNEDTNEYGDTNEDQVEEEGMGIEVESMSDGQHAIAEENTNMQSPLDHVENAIDYEHIEDFDLPLYDNASISKGNFCLLMSKIKTDYNIPLGAMNKLRRTLVAMDEADCISPKRLGKGVRLSFPAPRRSISGSD